ncbi:MAG TPA: sugar ABC transporter substrate-binding protein [Spirochaetia bacterium]|nr:sugar ABC transporter substrate-binding protein [Spirochaetia bacterium]
MHRGFLVVASALVVVIALAPFAFAGGGKETPEPTTLAIASTPANPSQGDYKAGADAFGKKAGFPVVDVLVKGLPDIVAEVARMGGNVVFFIDPSQDSDDAAIVQILEQDGVYFVTWGAKPVDLKVWSYPHWVAHISFDAVAAGYSAATELFKAFATPHQGKILAIQGPAAAVRSTESFQGLQKALSENTGVQLVQSVSGDWGRISAYNETRGLLATHPEIDGIWCANDEMALGAIQALKEAGLAGKVMVSGIDGAPEMLQAVKAGTAAATVMNDAKYRAGLGLAMSIAAKQGRLDVAAQPHTYRQFDITDVSVTKANIDQVIRDYVESTPDYDFSDFYARWSAAIP